MDRKLSKTAKKLMKSGNVQRAAELFEQAGDIPSAVAAYAQIRDFKRAGDLAISIGMSEDAVRYYRSGGYFELLGEYFFARKDLEQAAHYFTRAGKHNRAAEVYEKLVKGLMELQEVPGETRELSASDQRLLRLAASANARAGNHSRAARCYHRIEDYVEEAKNYLQSGEYLFAGEAYERARFLPEAGDAFFAGELFDRAADCYERDGNFQQAAECCSKIGQYKTSGELFERAGQPFNASRTYEEGNELDLAIKVLTRLKPDHSDYGNAVSRVIALSEKKKYLTPAAQRFLTGYLELELTVSRASHFYAIANLLELTEYHAESKSVYDRIEALDPSLLQRLHEHARNEEERTEQLSKTAFESILREDFHASEREEEYSRRKKLVEAVKSGDTGDSSDTLMSDVEDTLRGEGAPDRSMPLSFLHIQEGQKFGDRYIIMNSLGAGGMGAVYKARDLELDEICAIKILSPQLNMDQNAVARFKQEIKLARQVNHPNIIRIYDLGDLYGTKYITMEYFAGDQIKTVIQQQGPFELHSGLELILKVCSGLNAAHKLGIIHRDIKSQNIMISREGIVKVLDFGIAKSADIPGLTMDGSILGTPEYISPEAIMQKGVDIRSDIYSLGIVMYEVFTGKVPFTGTNIMAVIRQHLYDDPEAPTRYNELIPEELEDIILRCIERQPENRYQSVAELAAELTFLKSAYTREQALEMDETNPT